MKKPNSGKRHPDLVNQSSDATFHVGDIGCELFGKMYKKFLVGWYCLTCNNVYKAFFDVIITDDSRREVVVNQKLRNFAVQVCVSIHNCNLQYSINNVKYFKCLVLSNYVED